MSGLRLTKQKKTIVPWIVFVILLLTLVLAGWYGYRWYATGNTPPLIPVAMADPNVEETPIPEEMVINHKVVATRPRYISIPRLKVEKARVLEAEAVSGGQLDAPKNISDTAWYRESALPGDGSGAMLISGHNAGGVRDGVFAGLDQLPIGERITIQRGDGKLFTYTVAENKSMFLDEISKGDMKDMLYSVDPEKEGLNLITYDGNWVPRLQQFDRRIMLRAVLDS